MKHLILTSLAAGVFLLSACSGNINADIKKDVLPLQGTWKLYSATLIEKGDTTVTNYSENLSFIKVINASHFSFIKHNLTHDTDSAASFSAGAGTYDLKGNTYTEHLEYCNDRKWEDHDFTFNITIKNDTLIQSGIEKIENADIDRENIEKYVRLIQSVKK